MADEQTTTPAPPEKLNVQLTPEQGRFIYQGFEHSPLTGPEAKRHAADIQDAITRAASEFDEAHAAAATERQQAEDAPEQ